MLTALGTNIALNATRARDVQQKQQQDMSELRAIIFDVDGTLADTELNGHLAAYNITFAKLGLPWRWSEEQYRELLEITGGRERLRHFVGEHYSEIAEEHSDLESFIQMLHQTKNHHYEELLADNAVPLRTGVRRLIEEAREQGIRLAIATASQLSNVRSLLRHNLGDDALNWFEIIVGGDQIAAKKPAPDVYLQVMRELRLPADEVMAIEDSEQGLQAALKSGIRTLVTTNHFTEQQNFSGAVAVVNHLGEPDQPCHASCGDMHGSQYVNLNLLQNLAYHPGC